MYNQVQQIITQTLTNILNNTFIQISTIQLINKLPQFTHADILTKIYYQFHSFAQDPQPLTHTGMIQQHLQQVKLLNKDSLMPKGIQKQSQQIDHVTNLQNSINKKKKGMNNTRSSFNRSNIHSVGDNNTHRGSKISMFSKRKNKKQDSQCIVLQKQQEQDPQVSNLWKLKDIEIQAIQKDRRIIQAKKKSYQQKKQNFNKQLSQKQYTFDFQGDPIPNNQDQQRINLHQIRYRMGLLDRKLRSNIKFKNSQINTQVKINKKNSITLDDKSLSVQFTNMPIFQTQTNSDTSALFGIPSQLGKYKLKQYKKYYGGKFSRLDKSLNTLQLEIQKNDDYNQIFTQRRYFKDQQRKSINQSMVSYRTGNDQGTKRKLALPKIHGKYSTLDRYQS